MDRAVANDEDAKRSPDREDGGPLTPVVAFRGPVVPKPPQNRRWWLFNLRSASEA